MCNKIVITFYFSCFTFIYPLGSWLVYELNRHSQINKRKTKFQLHAKTGILQSTKTDQMIKDNVVSLYMEYT